MTYLIAAIATSIWRICLLTLTPAAAPMTDYQESDVWATKAILNVARTGFFSSDRTIAEYARDIWHIKPAAAGTQRESDMTKERQRAEVSR